ncbi:ThuA domain-containing protein [Hymenobacter properus]|uniref:ThuA domain-containing protein n=1 Tax=Hymenobacter properus TaxID=2791026 RepID=A0A931BLG0_9BACT|nr:ThuA domain-containing protein [Hymenobacter properus]MBF9143546.1 ThuA domain-containing protein [Hymenobacter properus]MBR7722359.1 ThuA domain-containing protein [Microvirga sp. SRT04]
MNATWVLVLFAGFLLGCREKPAPTPEVAAPPAVLVFSKTNGFRHASIGTGIEAIRQLGRENKFRVDTTTNANKFRLDTLRKYQAVVFLSTTQDVLDATQQTAFEQYIRLGRGFVGIHAATDTEYSWPWYNGLVGAYFDGHPAVQQATVRVTDKTHIASNFLPDNWVRTDEWYNFRNMVPGLHVLATLDETTYTGGTNGATHPIAWYHSYDGGRAFYTAGGHTDDSFREPLFVRHLLGGIRYAMGQ